MKALASAAAARREEVHERFRAVVALALARPLPQLALEPAQRPATEADDHQPCRSIGETADGVLMTGKLIGLTFTLAEIRAMHLPLTDRPAEGINAPCTCPVCQPASEEGTP